MSRHVGLRALSVLAPIALLLAPTAAHADSLTVDDPAGDAKAINMGVALGGLLGPESDGPFFLDAPAETSVDVASTTIDHARKRLTLTVHFRDLVEVEGHVVDFRIITAKGRYSLSAGVVDGRTRSSLSPARPSSVTVSSDGSMTIGPEPKPCRTVRARYDLAADTLVASVPTACLGQPSWVQVAAAASRTKLTPQADGSANIASYLDDAFRGGVSMNSIGRSPKVRRG